MKRCSKCNELRDRSAFHKDKTRKDGLFPQCKLCVKENTSRWLDANRERNRKTSAARYAANRNEILATKRARYAGDAEFRARVLAVNAAYRQTPAGRLCDRISTQNRRARFKQAGTLSVTVVRKVMARKTCYYCGCALVDTSHHPQQRTLEHKIPLARGGTNEISNLTAACKTCNDRKGSSTAEEFKSCHCM